MTDELDDGDASNATGNPLVAELGMEARAELQRLRTRLGLQTEDEGSEAPLPSLGRYRLERELGRGGMGVVYRAHDPEAGRAIAVKLVRGLPFVATEKLRARLLREAKALGQLTHPNVVRLYDVGSHEGEVYLAMEHVDGQTLYEWQTVRDHGEVIDAYVQAAKGLAAAHEVGIVHRDFKADNVFVAKDGRILVGDFGLAGPVAGDETELESLRLGAESESQVVVTKTGALLGTLAYMAPEQLRGDVATPRSDQFALCVSLWEALAGRRPFAGKNPVQLLDAIERGVPPPGEGISKKLHRVLQRGSAANPDDRYEDVLALAGALEEVRAKPTGLLLAALVAGVSLGTWALTSLNVLGGNDPAVQPCDLEDAIARVEESAEQPEVRMRLVSVGMAGALRDVEAHVGRIKSAARALCEQQDSVGEARRQHLRLWIENLDDFLLLAEQLGDIEIRRGIEDMKRARLSAPPPRPRTEAVAAAEKQSLALERLGHLDEALALAEQAFKAAGDREVDRAASAQRRARVLTLKGRHHEAMEAYGEAMSAAEEAAYDDARLEIEILSARTALVRLEELGRARDALAHTRGLLERLDEPWPSPRRADYHELRSYVLARSGSYGDALQEQWRSLSQRLWVGGTEEIGRSFLNLGNIHDRIGPKGLHPKLARLYYEHAFDMLAPIRPSPTWAQAAYGLGRWLLTSEAPQDQQNGVALLNEVRRVSDDLRPSATADLLIAAMNWEQWGSAEILAAELHDYLLFRRPPSPSDGFDWWQSIAVTAAPAADLAAVDDAYAKAEHYAFEIELDGSQVLHELQARRFRLELTLAALLEGVDLSRATAFARAAKRRIPQLVMNDELREMQAEVERILALEPD